MTKKYVSFCGYRCDLCPAYINNVDIRATRTKVREGWKNFFNFDVPEDRLLCVGCFDEGAHLDSGCPIRPCALQKGVQNCSFCYFFESCETLKLRADILDEIKKKVNGKISREDYQLFFRPYEGRVELKKQRKKG